MVALVLDRLALVATGLLVTAALAWLVFHPTLVGALDIVVTGLVLLCRPQATIRRSPERRPHVV